MHMKAIYALSITVTALVMVFFIGTAQAQLPSSEVLEKTHKTALGVGNNLERIGNIMSQCGQQISEDP
jgi:hypothetical protein